MKNTDVGGLPAGSLPSGDARAADATSIELPAATAADGEGDEAARSQDLKHRSISAVLWGALGAFLRAGLQIVSQVVLARLLGPEQFGLFALALVVVFFSTFFADIGLAYGLIQRKVVKDEDIRFVFTWQVLLGTAITALLFFLAPLVATFYDDPRLVPVMRWLSLTPLIGALGATASVLLRKDLNFKSINLANVVSYAVGFLAFGIPMALLGFGVEALIAAFLVQAGVQALYQVVARPHPKRPMFWQPSAKELLNFGGTVLATNVINWVMSSVDRVVVGRVMSMTEAGLYSTVHNFISGPTVTVLSLLQSVLYSASARVQDNQQSLRAAFRTMFGIVGLAIVPVFFTVAVVASTFMHAVYGERWIGGEVVLAPLALAMPAFLLMGLSTPILWTAGKVRQEFQLQIPIAIVWTAVLLAVSRQESLALLSWSVCALYYLRAGVIIIATIRAVELRVVEMATVLAPGVLVAALVMAAAAATDRGLADVLANPVLRLAAVIGVSAVTFTVMLKAIRPLLQTDVHAFLLRLAERVPTRLGRRFAHRLFA